MNQGSIQKLVNNFVEQLEGLWRQEIVAALGGGKTSISKPKNGNSSGGSNGSSVSGVSGGNGHGVKRTAEDLDQLAAQFVDFVKANPGLRIEQINKQLGSTTKALALPIRKLLAEGRIKANGQKRSTTYFAGDDKKSKKSKR